ncbi:hypothetical protein V6Z12_A02G109200 [Gossypium hirsutum]
MSNTLLPLRLLNSTAIQVKMNVGCLKMMRVGNMGPILFYNCILGIAVGILQIPL